MKLAVIGLKRNGIVLRGGHPLLGPIKSYVFKISTLTMAGALPMSCASTGEGEVPVKTHYTLEAGATTKSAAPMPSKTPIFIKWHFSDGHTESTLGFHGWDFDDDGRFEMVQVLSAGGKTEAYVYDFDGDGKVDRTQKLEDTVTDTTVIVPFSSEGDNL